ncbi:MAG: WbqC family protein [Saprospiraceae bacterium]
MEKTVLLELHYLPSIQYVSKLLQFSRVMLEQHENYSKGSYRNRCHLASSMGLLRLSLPLAGGKNQQQPIREVKLKYDEPWQNQHWTAIKSAYGKSPFFEHYEHRFLPIFQKKYEYLWDWNWDLLHVVLEIISLKKNIELTKKFDKELEEEIVDFRNKISPKENKKFEDVDFEQAKYVQVFEAENGFLPNLSILDLIFCAGPEAEIYLERSLKKV